MVASARCRTINCTRALTPFAVHPSDPSNPRWLPPWGPGDVNGDVPRSFGEAGAVRTVLSNVVNDEDDVETVAEVVRKDLERTKMSHDKD